MTTQEQKTTRRKELGIFLLFSFGLAWLLQIAASKALLQGDAAMFSPLLSLSMLCPLAGALACKLMFQSSLGVGWRPAFKGKLRWWAAAWFGPALLTFLGAALYFLIFPARLDTSGTALLASMGPEWDLESLKQELGITPMSYLLTVALQAVSFAPLINMLFAVGEEAGWRGFMMPRLTEDLGLWQARVVGGIIWAVWHWPVILLAGYEYGVNYLGAPVLGLLVWCVVCIALNTLLDWLYQKSGSIWVPSLAHGAFNAIAALPALLIYPEDTYYSVLGPMPVGIISILPALLLAVWVTVQQMREQK